LRARHLGHAQLELALLLVHLERGLVRRGGEACLAEALESRHELLVPEAAPALARVPERDHEPPVARRAGRVVGLALGELGPACRMDMLDARLVLLLRPAGELALDPDRRHPPS